MSFDPVDVWGGAVGSLLRRFLYFFSAVWMGSIVGIIALFAAWIVDGGSADTGMLWSLLFAPLVLLNGWFVVNFAVVVIGLAYCIKADDPSYRGWMTLAGLCSLGAKLADGTGYSGRWLPAAVGWVSWISLVIMLGAGVWLLRQYLATRWAHHLMQVQVETTVRGISREEIVRAKLEATRPPEAPPGVIVDLKR